MDLSGNDLLKRIIGLLCSEARPCYVAGGYVRERLLKQPGRDVDFAVDGAAVPLARRVADDTGGAFYVLDEQTDAARIVYPRPHDLTVDFAAMRGVDVIADLRARDFTINAMAVDVREWYEPEPQILDPCRGRGDLEARILRATSEHAFQQDPVRLLRALRFVATLNLSIEPHTESWIRRDAPLVTQPSAERIRQELALMVASPGAADHLRHMDDLGLMRGVIPELASLKGLPQPDSRAADVYEHTLATIAEVERLSAFPDAQLGPDEAHSLGPFAADLAAHFSETICEKRRRSTLLKFAAMLHGAGRSETSTGEADGGARFLGYERLSAEIATQVLTRLRFAAREIRLVSTVVAQHTRPGLLVQGPPVTGKHIYRFFRDTGDAGIDVLILSLAGYRAAQGAASLEDHWRRHLELTSLMLDNYFRKAHVAVAPSPLVSGRDVMTLLGLQPGPEVGRLLEEVREAQAEGQVRTTKEALEFLRQCST